MVPEFYSRKEKRPSSGLSGFFEFGVLSFSASNAGEFGCERRGFEYFISGVRGFGVNCRVADLAAFICLVGEVGFWGSSIPMPVLMERMLTVGMVALNLGVNSVVLIANAC